MKNYLLILLLPLFCSLKLVENPCGIMSPRGGDEDWGTGVYLIPENVNFPIYNPTTLKHIGYFNRNHSTVLTYYSDGKKIEQIWKHGIEFIGSYELTFIQVSNYPSDSNYCLINWKSTENSFLVNKQDLLNGGATSHTYLSLLTSENLPEKVNSYREMATLGVNVTKSCINLREAPSLESQKVKCIPGNDWNNELSEFEILEPSGDWARVKVQLKVVDQEVLRKGDYGDCYPYKVKEELTGWIKLVSENGFPNLWYSVTSY